VRYTEIAEASPPDHLITGIRQAKAPYGKPLRKLECPWSDAWQFHPSTVSQLSSQAVSETWAMRKGSSNVCTLIAYYQMYPTYPVVVAANRDEYYTRKARQPHMIHQQPRVYAGKDEHAGGTWLGVNEFGLVAGLLNRHSPEPQDPARRSRGLLCLDMLCQRDALAARDMLVTEARTHPYNSFYVFWADSEHAYLAYNEENITIRAIQPGRYLLTNSSLIDLSQLTPAGLGDLLTDPHPASLDAAIAPSVSMPPTTMARCLPVCWRLAATGLQIATYMPRAHHAARRIRISRPSSPTNVTGTCLLTEPILVDT
jgi:hypothetical protein